MKSTCCCLALFLALGNHLLGWAGAPDSAQGPASAFGAAGLERVKYNNPGLKVDLGVGLWAWPLPMDFGGDGDLDLVVSCEDVPYNGTYVFENTSGNVKMPLFAPGDGSTVEWRMPRSPTSTAAGRVLTPAGVSGVPRQGA